MLTRISSRASPRALPVDARRAAIASIVGDARPPLLNSGLVRPPAVADDRRDDGRRFVDAEPAPAAASGDGDIGVGTLDDGGGLVAPHELRSEAARLRSTTVSSCGTGVERRRAPALEIF